MTVDDIDDFEAELQGWLSAYPLSMFPEPDLAKAAEVLKAAGMTLDSISASNMRHVVGKIAPQALALISREKALREALEQVRGFLMTAPMESGVCCCGDAVDAHNMGSGHSPVDELGYAASREVERIDAALTNGASHDR